ncbi:MAG: magnesium/cobalt transporter CorA [Deltaproteobacteria bacterium]|nr:magnesium/cobalt transporter CorA [Deltaproteobacteria bacterium]
MNQNKKPQQFEVGRAVGGALSGALEKAVGTAIGSVGLIGGFLGSSLRLLPGLHSERAATPPVEPGEPPGISYLDDVNQPPEPSEVQIRCTDYCTERIESFMVDDLEAFLQNSRPDWAQVRWINIAGLHPYVVNGFCESLGFHILAAEDVLRVPQRPRVDAYDDHIFAVARMVSFDGDSLRTEQISLFITPRMLVTFQQSRDDLWKPILERLSGPNYRIRQRDVSYLAYTLLDTVVDHAFPVLERYSDVLEELEEDLLSRSSTNALHRIHAIKRELTVLWRIFLPMRELIVQLEKKDQILVSDLSRTFLRDVHDHCVQIIDIVDTFRDIASNLTDLYISLTSNQTNDVMRILTIIATIFIPITFFAGVYGMNFEHIPELKWRYSYAAFWIACGAIIGALLFYFRRKGWFKM